MNPDSDSRRWIRIHPIPRIQNRIRAADSNPKGRTHVDQVVGGQLEWQLLVEVDIGSWQLAVGMLKLVFYTELAVI